MNALKILSVAALCASAPWPSRFIQAAPPVHGQAPHGGQDPSPAASASGGHRAAWKGGGTRFEVPALLDTVLRASGLEEPSERQRHAARFAARLAEIEKEVGHARSPYRRARRLHDALHRHILRRYVPTADGIDGILDRGDYNCVSAALFYGMAARAFGLDVHVIETPRHIFLRLTGSGRDVDIESTSASGFDIRGDLERFRRFTWAYRFAAIGEMERRAPYARFERFEEPGQPVSLEQAVGFLWHNTAERALARGEALKAATSLIEEFRAYPDLATRLDGFATSLARAFRIEYEAGNFGAAYRIAAMELEISPTRTSSRDRFLAVASKRIEASCEQGDPGAAEAILGLAAKVIRIPTDRARLEREVCPRIAAAAVRAGDWDRAHRLAFRYAEIEPDTVETGRFIAWVESRETGTVSLDHAELCVEPQGMRPLRAAPPLHTDSPSAAAHGKDGGPETGDAGSGRSAPRP